MDESDDEVNVSVRATEDAVEQFAKTYLPDVIVLAPMKLAEKIEIVINDTLARYKKIHGREL
ncbi:MAG: hypothetical protein LIO96_15095 [Lachnospiraceae bacterium]|nr:hypothetical protein [Lachnospiraceae bacterium]